MIAKEPRFIADRRPREGDDGGTIAQEGGSIGYPATLTAHRSATKTKSPGLMANIAANMLSDGGLLCYDAAILAKRAWV
jgi:hypothetical protein